LPALSSDDGSGLSSLKTLNDCPTQLAFSFATAKAELGNANSAAAAPATASFLNRFMIPLVFGAFAPTNHGDEDP
jgi:hypothetical protein